MGYMKNDHGAAFLPSGSRSRVETSPTGRLISAELTLGLLLKQQQPCRPLQGMVRLLQHGERVISLEMDYSQVEARIFAAYPQAAQLLKRR
jgi:hypothetical protein